ncbi:hypothetical protein H5410_060931, partial [Solanum commersonii]
THSPNQRANRRISWASLIELTEGIISKNCGRPVETSNAQRFRGANKGRLKILPASRRVLWVTSGFSPKVTDINYLLSNKLKVRWGKLKWFGELDPARQMTQRTYL